MPWLLRYPNNLEGRILRNTHRMQFIAHPDVRTVEVQRRGVPGLTVAFRDEIQRTSDPQLLEIAHQYEAHPPLTTQSIRGFGTTDRGEQPNTNGDSFQGNFLQEALRSAEGRSRLAQAMVAPLRARMDYQSVGRRAFLVEQLPQGALPVYDRDTSDGVPPMPPPAKFVCPEWVQAGQWVYHEAMGRYAMLTQVSMLHVGFTMWRTDEYVDMGKSAFVANWTPCEKPKDPRTGWERLGLDLDEP